MPSLVLETQTNNSYEELGSLPPFTCTEYMLTDQAM